MFRQVGSAGSTAKLPDGHRIYAIGDVHGEADLLEQLFEEILVDTERRCPANTILVMLGDFIDRGEDAAGLLDLLARINCAGLIILKGNHEAALVQSYRGDAESLRFWLQFGGVSTLIGENSNTFDIDRHDARELMSLLQARVTERDIEWLDHLPTSYSLGDYYFTHAGIRPGVKLEAQDVEDLLWIREPFLSSRRDHGKVIVHGHTIEKGLPQLGGNRIGIDTGAHEHGTISALGLEGREQWIIQATCSTPAAAQDFNPRSSDLKNVQSLGLSKSQALENIERLIHRITAPTFVEPDAKADIMPLPVSDQSHFAPGNIAIKSNQSKTSISLRSLFFALLIGSGLAFLIGYWFASLSHPNNPIDHGAVSAPADTLSRGQLRHFDALMASADTPQVAHSGSGVERPHHSHPRKRAADPDVAGSGALPAANELSDATNSDEKSPLADVQPSDNEIAADHLVTQRFNAAELNSVTSKAPK